MLEGSVRKAGNRVRITAQLIDGAKGDHIWAARYDRDLTDIFEIQDEISKAIVDALKVKLLPAEKKAIESRGTSDVEAYSLYLMARQQWISGTVGNPRREESIIRLCHQATLLDPDYAEAWALMAIAQLELRFVHGRDESALAAAERALEINPALPEAHCIKARYLEEEGKTEEAERQIRTALKLGPDSWEVNREVARMLFRHARIQEAIPYFEKAASLMETDWHNPLMLRPLIGQHLPGFRRPNPESCHLILSLCVRRARQRQCSERCRMFLRRHPTLARTSGASFSRRPAPFRRSASLPSVPANEAQGQSSRVSIIMRPLGMT